MTPSTIEINYSIQSNGSGPGYSSHKSKGKDCQPRGEAQMEDARTSTSSQRLECTFNTLIESPEAVITSIPVVRPEPFPTGNNRNIPFSVQELVYGGKQQEWELLPSLWIGTMNSYLQVRKFMIPEKTEVLLRGWTPMSWKGKVQQIKAWLNNKACCQRTRRNWPKERTTAQWKLPKPPQAKVCLNKCQKKECKPQRAIRRSSKRKRARKSPSGTSLTHRTTEFSRKRRQPWTMCSIWQEL
ncbi:hypothetical protein O181_107740 [Austropuccinia psidii MF-1]|uniref:Uncharacterized protein n=1 Tax=Austropuccinia psidii MF-1 TaxID=1389203 RepID=A0A9Q3PNY2_9BASI|nr:hypothetical protein [Austropuccinia psidii MF-1]